MRDYACAVKRWWNAHLGNNAQVKLRTNVARAIIFSSFDNI